MSGLRPIKRAEPRIGGFPPIDLMTVALHGQGSHLDCAAGVAPPGKRWARLDSNIPVNSHFFCL